MGPPAERRDLLFYSVFMAAPDITRRIECILDGDGDPDPGGTSSKPFEAVMAALAAGKPQPMESTQLLDRIDDAMTQLFAFRDAVG